MKLPARLKNEEGFMIPLVVVLSLLTAFIFAYILPQLHMGQQIAAITNLNEQRAYEAANKGSNAVRLGIKNTIGSIASDLYKDATSGIGLGIKDICGAQLATQTNHFLYRDPDGNPQYVSGVQGIVPNDLDYPNDFSMLQVAVLTRTLSGTFAAYYYDSRINSTDDANPNVWMNSTGLSNYFYQAGPNNANYIDFDGNGSGSYDTKADVKYQYTGGDWKISIGNDGTYRKTAGLNELWNFEFDFSAIANRCSPGSTRWPFYDQDNSQSGGIECCSDINDCVEIFVIVRASGITAATKVDYDPVNNNKSLDMVKTETGLPNPIPQRIETGYFLVEEGPPWDFKIKRFFFRKVHNLKE